MARSFGGQGVHTASDIRSIVLALAQNNPGWGYTKIRDALRGLKIEIGRTTVANLLGEAGIEPAPGRRNKRTWKQFLGVPSARVHDGWRGAGLSWPG